jgi:ABC-type sugar transport system substrate-binding protein/tRNA A-37 threonylcarbamoyl transferase component Bud32
MYSGEFVGRQIGEFRVEELIGEGAMATVYRAYQSSMNRQVALKIIRLDRELGHSTEFQRRFAQEAEMIARLEHIHILPVFNYGIDGNVAYLAMRWLRGGTLSDRLRQGPLPLDEAARLFEQIARGLGYAHSKGVIHRDLKPSNIMLDDTGNAFLTDFGLAKLVEGSAQITKSGNIVGTPAYMAPEQLRGEPLDHRADLYSLGVILYHMVVGRLPFDAASSDIITVIYQHLEKPPPAPRTIDPRIPREVESVILRALQKDRGMRFDSAEDLSNALNAALGRDSTTTRPAVHVTRRARPGWLYGVVTLVVIVLLVLLLGQVVAAQQAEAARQAQTQVALAMTATATLWTATPSPTATAMPKATVIAGDVGTADDLVPSAAEIEVAQERLGERGFIAYVTCTQDSEWHATQAREMRDLAESYGLVLNVYDSEIDEYRQITLIERARTEGASAIILCPLNPTLLDAPLSAVDEADLPLVIGASGLPSYGGVRIEGDEYLMGLMPGQAAGQAIASELNGEANVIILDYPDLPAIVTRANGLEDGVLEFAPDANIIGRFLGASRENGEAAVRQLLDDGVEFNVIVSINDAGAFGAIAALEAAGIDPDSVMIFSVDAEVLARQYIRNQHFMRGSVALDRKAFSDAMVNAAVRLLSGATMPEIVLVPPGDVVTRETLVENDN